MFGFDKISNHPILVMIAISSLTYTGINILEIKPLEKETINLQNNLKNCTSNVKSSQEYLHQRDKLLNAKLEIKDFENKAKNYDSLLKENSYLKVENETLKNHNDELKEKNNSLQTQNTCLNQIEELRDKFNSESYYLKEISQNGSIKEIEASKMIVNSIEEQIKSISKCLK